MASSISCARAKAIAPFSWIILMQGWQGKSPNSHCRFDGSASYRWFGNVALKAFPNRAGLSGERNRRATRPLAEKKKNSFPYVQGRTGGGQRRTRNPAEPEAICHSMAGHGGAAIAQDPLRNSVEKS